MKLTANNVFRPNRGSDLLFTVTWPNGAGAGLNLTGYTVDGFEVDSALAPYLTLTITNAAAGVIEGRVTWNDSLPVHRDMSFRIRIAKDGIRTTTNILKVCYE